MTVDGNPGNRNYGGPSLEPGEIASAAGTRLTKRWVALAAQSNFGWNWVGIENTAWLVLSDRQFAWKLLGWNTLISIILYNYELEGLYPIIRSAFKVRNVAHTQTLYILAIYTLWRGGNCFRSRVSLRKTVDLGGDCLLVRVSLRKTGVERGNCFRKPKIPCENSTFSLDKHLKHCRGSKDHVKRYESCTSNKMQFFSLKETLVPTVFWSDFSFIWQSIEKIGL